MSFLTLNNLIGAFECALSSLEDDRRAKARVLLEFPPWMTLTLDFFSYRGLYDHVALGVAYEGGEIKATEYLAWLKTLPGQELHGHKGGTYNLNPNYPCFMALCAGDYSQVGIAGLHSDAYDVYLKLQRDS